MSFWSISKITLKSPFEISAVSNGKSYHALLLKSPPRVWCIFQEGHTNTIKTLLQLGADLHAKDKKGRSGKKFSHLDSSVEYAVWSFVSFNLFVFCLVDQIASVFKNSKCFPSTLYCFSFLHFFFFHVFVPWGLGWICFCVMYTCIIFFSLSLS